MNYLINLNIFLFDLFLIKSIEMFFKRKKHIFHYNKNITSNVKFYDLNIVILFNNKIINGKKFGNSFYFKCRNKIIVINKINNKIIFLSNQKGFDVEIKFDYLFNTINKKMGKIILLNNNSYIFNSKCNINIQYPNIAHVCISDKLFISKYAGASLVLEKMYFDESIENIFSKIKYIVFKNKKYIFENENIEKIKENFSFLLNKKMYNYAYLYSALKQLKGNKSATNLYILLFILKLKFINNKIIINNTFSANFTIFLKNNNKISVRNIDNKFFIEKDKIKLYNFNAIQI